MEEQSVAEFELETLAKRDVDRDGDEKSEGRRTPFKLDRRGEYDINPVPIPIQDYKPFMNLPNLRQLQSILDAAKSTGRIDMVHRKEIINTLKDKLQNYLDHHNIHIRLPEFDQHEIKDEDLISTNDIKFVREHTVFDKINLPVAARLMAIAGYNQDVVERLIKAGPVKRPKMRKPSKTAIASKVKSRHVRPLGQKALPAPKSIPARPKSPAPKPRPKPRSTSPKPVRPKSPSRTRERSKSAGRTRDKSKSPTRGKSGSPKHKARTRVPVGTPSPFIKHRRR